MKIPNIILPWELTKISEISDELPCSLIDFEGSSKMLLTSELFEVKETKKDPVAWGLIEVSKVSDNLPCSWPEFRESSEITFYVYVESLNYTIN